MAERLGLDQRTIRWLEAHAHLQRLALTEPEIRARLYHAHLAHQRPEAAGERSRLDLRLRRPVGVEERRR